MVSPRAEPEQPARECPLCPRLVRFREENRTRFPDFWNAPVASFGPLAPRLLVVGLAPGLRGANRTARPFTGDFAGELLYSSLLKVGLARGTYGAAADDGLTLVGCRITNAVRCVPPENKVTGGEIDACNRFLASELSAVPRPGVVVALGTVAHRAVLKALGQRASAWPFEHGRLHRVAHGLTLVDSYHCSRQNTSTGRLTRPMFEAVLESACSALAHGR